MTETQKTYDFNWRVPPVVTPSFIEGLDAEAFLEEFKGRVERNYNGNPNLKVLNYNGEVVTGSNSFAVVLANEILRPQGIRTTTLSDLGEIVESNSLPLRGQYVDSALVSRTNGDSYEPNDSLAKNMFAQIRDSGITPTPEVPVVIPLKDLDLTNANNFYGLGFKLRDDAELIEAPELSGKPGRTFNKMKKRKFNKTDERGLPIFDKNGEIKLFARNKGLSRFGLDGGSDLNSSWYDLGGSMEICRVVLVKE